MIPSEVFLDASFAIALTVASDRLHSEAVALAEEVDSRATRLVTTPAVLLEIGNYLSKQRYRRTAGEILTSIASDPGYAVVPISDDLYMRALAMYQVHDDKEWGMTDCISFVVMRERGLTHALSADEHFCQAGFVPMLVAG
jgi:predicted nucleic acid-binding protein